MSRSPVRAAVLGFALAVTVIGYLAPAVTAQTPGTPVPGAASGDDALFPGLGNGGYDVLHYDLGLVYESAAPAQSLPMRAAITARATQALSRLNLDYAGDAVSSVAIDGAPAGFVREGEELS